MIKYEHPILPPTLLKINGKKFLVPGFKEVPMDTKWEDIKWVKKQKQIR